MLTLPAGSLWRAARDALNAWSPERHRVADIIDAMWQLPYLLVGADPGDAPRVKRPADYLAETAATERSRVARSVMQETAWEEV